ncbi:Druantia anti-phage system protein DruA [Isosphaera pallida]|nr:Druantia anti-phage system protein DruA [Isosphaera pallida]
MATPSSEERAQLRELIENSLRRQGFCIRNGQIHLSENPSKDKMRRLHRLSVQHRIEKAQLRLGRHEDRLLQRIASGSEIDPAKVAPRLVEVLPDSEDELLFRYASLHWSIPTSSGYGRRLRFLVEDAHNGKLIGLFGLCDPVFSVGARDKWIGWNLDARKTRLRNVMEAFILGSVPPYSMLLGGKLVAMLCGSDEVRDAFRRKYSHGESWIRGHSADGRLAMIATTSALGRSSIYNRLRFADRLMMFSVGFTSGWGEFQFTNGAYSQLRDYAEKYCDKTAKHKSWGVGFRNRREVVRRVLAHVGLSGNLMNHGIRRELFVMPLAENAREFLRGEHQQLMGFHQPADELAAFFLRRWLVPRAERCPEFAGYSSESFRLWRK